MVPNCFKVMNGLYNNTVVLYPHFHLEYTETAEDRERVREGERGRERE